MSKKPKSFTVKKQNEFFISIAKKGIHSFMMVGVIDNDGSPRLLARVGKTNSIDSDINSPLKMTAKALGDGTLAIIADEGVTRRATFSENIEYSAYSINYEQAKEFLGLIAQIEKKQHNDPVIKKAITDSYVAQMDSGAKSAQEEMEHEALTDAAIEAFVPTEQKDSDEVKFEFKKLRGCEFNTVDEQKLNPLAEGAKQIQIRNTCRSTALNVVEAVLGFATNVSKLFFISPDYKTEMKGGNPDKQSFYILPPPPIIKNGEFSDAQYAMLQKMHKRLENIHKLNPDDHQTRAKFDALKETYKSIFGENNLSAGALLSKLGEHAQSKKEALFERRAQNFVSKALGFTSSTERMFVDMKNELTELKKEEKEPDNENKNTNAM